MNLLLKVSRQTLILSFSLFCILLPAVAGAYSNNAIVSTCDFDGVVSSMVTAPDDSVYVAGNFNSANCPNGSFKVTRIAHLNTDGTFDTNFNYELSDSGAYGPDNISSISSMILDGTTLYLGSDFNNFTDSTGNYARRSVVALDSVTGNVIQTFLPLGGGVSDIVFSLAKHNNQLLIGGKFSSYNDDISSYAASSFAVVDATDGRFDPNWNGAGVQNGNQIIHEIKVDGDYAYIGGSFKTFIKQGGLFVANRFMLLRLDLTQDPANDAILDAWSSDPNDQVEDLFIEANYLYLRGKFSDIAGVNTFYGLARIDIPSATPDSGWKPVVSPFGAAEEGDLFVQNNHLYFGTAINDIDGNFRQGLASFDLTTTPPILDAFDPQAINRVDAIAGDVAGNILYISGDFGSVGPDSHKNFAKFSPDSINGTVFDDVNYGGGKGRSLTDAQAAYLSSIKRPGVTVELYDANTGDYLSSDITDINGNYSLAVPIQNNPYFVRVVDNTVTSARTDNNAYIESPILTYYVNSDGVSTSEEINSVGGVNPNLLDSPINGGADNFSSLTSGGTFGVDYTPQSYSTVKFQNSSVYGIDFGFNFDTIVNTNDVGRGSLRQVMMNADTLADDAGLAQESRIPAVENSIWMLADGTSYAGTNGSYPNLLGTVYSGFFTILPSADLPVLLETLTLDANTQNGAIAGTPIIDLDGNMTLNNALVLGNGQNLVRGFAIHGFNNVGIGFFNKGGNVVKGNWIGLDPGTGDAIDFGGDFGIECGNGTGGVAGLSCEDNVFGGSLAEDRNIIVTNPSGGSGGAIYLDSSLNNTIQGNWIGLNKDGLTIGGVPGNYSGYYGIYINNLTSNNQIGGSGLARNVVAASFRSLLNINSAGGNNNQIVNNYFGTDITGTVVPAVPEIGTEIGGLSGVNNYVGINGLGNLFAGPMFTNLQMGDVDNIVVQSNTFGTNAAGNALLGSTSLAVLINNTDNLLFGGTNPGDGNILAGGISMAGPGQAGVGLDLIDSTNAHVYGNYFGTNANGDTGLGNNVGMVVVGFGTPTIGNVIGGLLPQEKNVFGNNMIGFAFYGPTSTGNSLIGNYFGTDSLGNNIANGFNNLAIDPTLPIMPSAIMLANGANGNLIQENIIRNTVYPGVGQQGMGVFVSNIGNTSYNNNLDRNIIQNNSGLPVDLEDNTVSPTGNDGVTGNDGLIQAAQPEHGVDYPIITIADLSGGNVTINGYVGANSGAAIFAGTRVQIYKVSDDGNQNGEKVLGDGLNVGHGEVSQYLGETIVDGTGNFAVVLPAPGLLLTDKIVGISYLAGEGNSEFGPNYDLALPIIVPPIVPPVVSGAGGPFGRPACSGQECDQAKPEAVTPNICKDINLKNSFEIAGRDYQMTDEQNHWSAKYVNALFELKLKDQQKFVVDGYLGDTVHLFRPDQEITVSEYMKMMDILTGKLSQNVLDTSKLTREQAVKMIADKYCNFISEKPVLVNPFFDVSITDKHAGVIRDAKAHNVISGYAQKDGIFGPKNNLTRAEAVKILLKSFLKFSDSDLVPQLEKLTQ